MTISAPTPSDQALLALFLETRDQSAFHTLAARHIDWIYSTALRLTQNPALAEDVTQGVLLALARKAPKLLRHPALPAWLFRATRYGAHTLLRSERRRKRHEGAIMPPSQTVPDLDSALDWSELSPRLDAAVARLSTQDQQAILLRFYQQLTHPAIAAALRITEEAARKRVDRALARLRIHLNVTSPTTLASTLTTSLALSAPKHLSANLLTRATPHALAATKGITSLFLLSTLKTAAAITLLTLIPLSLTAAVVVYESQPSSAPAPIAAANPPAPAIAPSPYTSPAPTTLTGTVLDIAGKPLPNAYISLIGDSNSPSKLLASTRSAPDGSFSLPAPSPSIGPRSSRSLLIADLPGAGFSQPLPATTPSPITLQLITPTQARIPLLDPAAHPAPNIPLFPTFINFQTGTDSFGPVCFFPPELSQRWTTTSDPNGLATFSGLPHNARIRLDTTDPRFAQIDFRNDLPLPADPTYIAKPLQLLPATTITGTLTFADTHLPIPNIPIHTGGLDNNPHMSSAQSTTDAAGRFTLSRLAQGQYAVVADASSQPDYAVAAPIISTSPDAPTSASLLFVHGGLLTGTVRDKSTGKGLPHLPIGLHGPAHPMEAAEIENHLTDADGHFSFRVPPGQQFIYLAQDAPDGYLAPDANPSHPVPVTVAEGQTVTYNFDLAPDNASSISGTVLDQNGGPVPNATVLCTIPPAPRRGPFTTLSTSKSLTTDAQGHFTLTGFRKGIILRARSATSPIQATLKSTTVNFPNDDITLELSATPTYTLTVTPTDPEGKRVPNTTVALGAMSGYSGLRSAPVPLNADGAIHFDNLFKDTTYFVSAFAPNYGEAQGNVKSPDESANTQSLKLTLHKADTPISGTVRDEAGNPLPNIEVAVNGAIGTASTKTDANGHYQFLLPQNSRTLVYIPQPTAYILAHPKAKLLAHNATAGDTNLDFTLPSDLKP